MKALAPGQLALDVQRLWSLAGLEQTVRRRSLHSLTLLEVFDRLRLPQRHHFDELFASRVDYLQASFDEALALAAETVARAYRSKERRSWLGRMRAEMQAMLDAYDEEPRFSGVLVVSFAQVAPELYLEVRELPPGKPNNPYRHRLGTEELVLVLDGLPTLCTAGLRRDLYTNEAVPIYGERNGHELLNCTNERVRILALSSRGIASSGV